MEFYHILSQEKIQLQKSSWWFRKWMHNFFDRTQFETLFGLTSLVVDVNRIQDQLEFPKFAQLWEHVSPSSSGVRSSDYKRWKGLGVNFHNIKLFSKTILTRKSYSPRNTHHSVEIRFHTPSVTCGLSKTQFFNEKSTTRKWTVFAKLTIFWSVL